MINSKKLSKISIALIIISIIGCIGAVYMKNENAEVKSPDYEDKLFGEDILEIDIEVNEEDWQSLLDNPLAKEYVSGDLIINGNKFSTVGIRTKGNTSLTQVAQMEDSDRYSLEFKSNCYIKGQTFYGLDSFCINNMISDPTYMKDYLAYDLMEYIGVDTPLTNYANVTVNGEDFGFYIAIERYSKSFLDRVYNTSGGELYNIKMSMGGKDDSNQDGKMEKPETDNKQNNESDVNNVDNVDNGNAENNVNDGKDEFNPGEAEGKDGPPYLTKKDGEFPNKENSAEGERKMDDRGGMGDKGGGSLVYTDDNISSYSSIFDNAVFKKNSDKDKERVITALKNLNEGNDLEKYIDVDKTLRYLAAHTVLVNLDSYSSNMAQNYYLYENDGKLTILPWDYNLSFGGFQGRSAGDAVNFPIDTPVSGVSMEERPLINKLLEVDEYKEKYHNYLQEIVDGYFDSGVFKETILSVDEKINEYVKNDATSFTTYEKYQSSLPVLMEFGALRAESINGQLNENIPSTTETQKESQDLLVDASNIDLSDLGGFTGGGFDGRKNEDDARNFTSNNKDNNSDMQRKAPVDHQKDSLNNHDNFLGNQDFTPGLSKEYILAITLSLLLLGGAFILMYKRKKNY